MVTNILIWVIMILISCIVHTLYSGLFKKWEICTGPLADSHEIKGFFIKANLDKIKVASLKF